jgi:hypothetical protein
MNLCLTLFDPSYHHIRHEFRNDSTVDHRIGPAKPTPAIQFGHLLPPTPAHYFLPNLPACTVLTDKDSLKTSNPIPCLIKRGWQLPQWTNQCRSIKASKEEQKLQFREAPRASQCSRYVLLWPRPQVNKAPSSRLPTVRGRKRTPSLTKSGEPGVESSNVAEHGTAGPCGTSNTEEVGAESAAAHEDLIRKV